jgi:hypothetical protein
VAQLVEVARHHLASFASACIGHETTATMADMETGIIIACFSPLFLVVLIIVLAKCCGCARQSLASGRKADGRLQRICSRVYDLPADRIAPPHDYLRLRRRRSLRRPPLLD